MVRNTAREIAIHLSYELSFTDKPVEELLDERLTPESFAALAEEDPLYQETPNAKQADYIRRLVRGVADHAPELDGYIAKYAKGWNFARIPLVASAIMRVAMYEILYMPDTPSTSRTAPTAMAAITSSEMLMLPFSSGSVIYSLLSPIVSLSSLFDPW